MPDAIRRGGTNANGPSDIVRGRRFGTSALSDTQELPSALVRCLGVGPARLFGESIADESAFVCWSMATLTLNSGCSTSEICSVKLPVFRGYGTIEQLCIARKSRPTVEPSLLGQWSRPSRSDAQIIWMPTIIRQADCPDNLVRQNQTAAHPRCPGQTHAFSLVMKQIVQKPRSIPVKGKSNVTEAFFTSMQMASFEGMTNHRSPLSTKKNTTRRKPSRPRAPWRLVN